MFTPRINPRSVDDNPEQSKQLNLNGTEYLLNAANNIGAKFIYISSFAALFPNTLYGKLKKQAEEYIVSNAKVPYLILQPSVIFGLSPNTENDRPFNRLLNDLKNNTIPTYDDSWKFQPTYLGHLVEVIKIAVIDDISNHTLPIAVPTLHSRYSIARDILTSHGIEVKSEDLGKKADNLINLDLLQELNLPQYTYSQMLDQIDKELE